MRANAAAALFAFAIVGAADVASADIVCGDVNDSGSVSTSDALAVLRRSVGQDVALTCGPPGEPVRTGQTTPYGSGSDGDRQDGSVRTFTDNGDGTITDYATGLMWEKKDDLGGIHDRDSTYTWTGGTTNMNGTAVTNFLANLNAGGGFAGHTDWRLPNRFELETLLNLQFATPSTHNRFNWCSPGCSISTCNCTQSGHYWTSTSSASSGLLAWYVDFAYAALAVALKTEPAYVRAVRNAPNLAATPTCTSPDPPQCLYNDPCTEGVCSLSRESCSYQSHCPLAPDEQCCCGGICI